MPTQPNSGRRDGVSGNPWRGPANGGPPPWEQPLPTSPPDAGGEATQRIRFDHERHVPPAAQPQSGLEPGSALSPAPGSRNVAQSELIARVVPADNVWTRIVAAIRHAFGSSKQPRELEEVLAAVQAPVSTGHRLAVTSVRGGAGKTALSALLGSALAARRPDPVLAVDADPENGSLGWRLGVGSALTLAGLAPGLHTASGQDLTNVAKLLPHTADGLWVAPGGSAGQPTLARDITRALSRLFAVAVLDCETGMNTPSTSAVLSDAHAIVIVTPATPDGVRTTSAAVDRIAASQTNALRRVVIALNTIDPAGLSALKLKAAEAAFARYQIPTIAMPYDRHVASGAIIEPGKLSESTFFAASRLAAAALGRARQL